MLFFLQAGKANIYWRGYFWLSVGSPELLNIPTYPCFWQLLLGLSSKSKFCRVVASLDRTLQAMLPSTDTAKRFAYGLFSGGYPSRRYLNLHHDRFLPRPFLVISRCHPFIQAVGLLILSDLTASLVNYK
jgi:hypothetical protein